MHCEDEPQQGRDLDIGQVCEQHRTGPCGTRRDGHILRVRC